MPLSAAAAALLTDRDFETYVSNLQLHDGILESAQTIMDLGAGFRQEFARGLRAYNPKARVISIDPRLGLSEERDLSDLFPEEHADRLNGRRNPQPLTIAALADALPIANSTIDLIVAQHSIPQYIHSTAELARCFGEILRILRPGGQARLWPITTKDIPRLPAFPFTLFPAVRGKQLLTITRI